MENDNGDTSSYQNTFDNLFVLREFCNISNSLSDEEFLAIVPKDKMESMRWIAVFKCIKQDISNKMMMEMNSMWSVENMHQKIEILEKQREKYAEINPNNPAWRPQHTSVKNQLRALDAAVLKEQKVLLESMLKIYNDKVNKLKETLQAKRQYIKAITMDMQVYEKNVEELITKISDRVQAHSVVDITPDFNKDFFK